MSRLATAVIVAATAFAGAALSSTLVFAAGMGNETLNYSYDAKGRLVRVEHSGTINANVVSNYSFDKADNRVNVNVTGAP